MSELRMNAYYYSFEPTGVDCVDLILSAVAEAGKAYHHTESWSDENSYADGMSLTSFIQEQAINAAAHIADLKRQHVEELAKMAGDQLARDADMYNLAEENRRLREALQKLAPAAREILWCALCWNDHNHSYADLTAKAQSAAKSLGLIRGEIDEANRWFESIAATLESKP